MSDILSLSPRQLFGIIAMVILLLIGAYMAGDSDGQRVVRVEAVKRGLAKWNPNAYGSVVFEWTCSVGKEPYYEETALPNTKEAE